MDRGPDDVVREAGPRHRALVGYRRALARLRGLPRRARLWLAGAAAGLLVAVGVLGFGWPGFFVSTEFDDQALRDGVRVVLERDLRLPKVTDVRCPPGQRVQADAEFLCTAKVNGAPSTVPVRVLDRSGRYAVGRPY